MGDTQSKEVNKVSEVDLENERRQKERAERLRDLENKKLANAEEREKRNRQTEEFYSRMEALSRERQKQNSKKQEEMETENVINLVYNEANRNDEESHRKQQEAIEQMHETQRLAEKRRQQYEQEMETLREQTRIELEKSRAMWDDRRRKLDEQMQIINRVMIHGYWTNRLAAYFTTRLNFLRTSNREIIRNYNIFMEVLMIVERENALNMPVELVRSKMKVLKKSIDAQRELMENESEDYDFIVSNRTPSVLSIIFGTIPNGQLLFVRRIKDCTDNVVHSCNQFAELVSTYELSNLQGYIGKLKAAYVDLCAKCDAIPTFEHSKSTYNLPSSRRWNRNVESSQFEIKEIE